MCVHVGVCVCACVCVFCCCGCLELSEIVLYLLLWRSVASDPHGSKGTDITVVGAVLNPETLHSLKNTLLYNF